MMRKFFSFLLPFEVLVMGSNCGDQLDRVRLLIATNLSRYPPKMIPSVDVIVCTTATNDRDARVLLSSMGIPFHGKHVN